MKSRLLLTLFAAIPFAAGCGPAEQAQQDSGDVIRTVSATDTDVGLKSVDIDPDPAPAAPETLKEISEPAASGETGEAPPERIQTIEPAAPGDTESEAPADREPEAVADSDASAGSDPVFLKRDERAEKDSEEPTTVQGRFEKAVTLLQVEQDIDGALPYLEKVIEEEPKHRQGLLLLAAVLRAQGARFMQREESEEALALLRKSIGHMRTLKAEYKEFDRQESVVFVGSLYSEASVLAQGDKPADALVPLKEAVESGLINLMMLDQDPQLAPLKALKEFKQFRTDMILAGAKAVLKEHKPFEFDFSLPNLDGEQVALADYAGKVVIVDFWGTWCPPCRQEIPHFVELYEKYKKKGLEIVGLNDERQGGVGPAEAPAVIKEFAKEYGVTYQCLIVDDATIGQVPEFRAFPTTLFIDRSGKVRGKVEGYQPLESLEAIVTLLLAEKSEDANPKAGQAKSGAGG